MASVLNEPAAPGEERLTGPVKMRDQWPALLRGIWQGGAHPGPGWSGVPDREQFQESL
jgi:hypothetical protein